MRLHFRNGGLFLTQVGVAWFEETKIMLGGLIGDTSILFDRLTGLTDFV